MEQEKLLIWQMLGTIRQQVLLPMPKLVTTKQLTWVKQESTKLQVLLKTEHLT